MIKYLIVTMVVLFLFTACSDTLSENVKLETTEIMTYSCENKKQVNVSYFNTNDHVQIDFNGVSYDLKRVRSASGEKYSNGKQIWWSKGTTALFEISDSIKMRHCVFTQITK